MASTTTAGEITARVSNLMGDPAESFITAANIYEWINDAQQEIAKITECVTSNYTIASIAGQEAYALNPEVLKIIRATYQGRKIQPISYDRLEMIDPHRDTDTVGGVPTHYFVEGDEIGLWKKPSTSIAGALKFKAVIVPVIQNFVPGTLLLIPEMFRENVVAYCMIKARSKDESPEMVQIYMDDWRNKLAIAKSIANNRENSYVAIQDTEGFLDYLPDYWTA